MTLTFLPADPLIHEDWVQGKMRGGVTHFHCLARSPDGFFFKLLLLSDLLYLLFQYLCLRRHFWVEVDSTLIVSEKQVSSTDPRPCWCCSRRRLSSVGGTNECGSSRFAASTWIRLHTISPTRQRARAMAPVMVSGATRLTGLCSGRRSGQP